MNKIDIYLIFLLVLITAFSRVVLISNYGENMFYSDPYRYYHAAISLSQGDLREATSYVGFLSLLLTLIPDSVDQLKALRYAVIIFSIELTVFVYSLARNIFKPIFALMTSLIASFEPLSLSHSINLHNDIFALSMGVASLYFITKDRKLLNLIIAAFLLILSSSARFEMYLIFGIPFLIYVVRYCSALSTHLAYKNALLYMRFMAVTLYVLPFILMQGYYYEYTRFNIFEKISLFLKPHLVRILFERIFAFTGEPLFDNLFLIFILSGLMVTLFDNKVRLQISSGFQVLVLRKRDWTHNYLFLIFILYILILVIFGFEYRIVGDQVEIIERIGDRYLIGLKILLVFPFVYTLANIVSLLHLRMLNHLNQIRVQYDSHKKRRIQISPKELSLFPLLLIVLANVNIMWNGATAYTADQSQSYGSFNNAAKWLSQNLKEGEIAVLPQPHIFYGLEPALKNRVEGYKILWDSAGVVLRADITDAEVMKVCDYSNKFIKTNYQLKYLVLDWIDPYANLLFKAKNCDALHGMLIEVKSFNFVQPHAKWSSAITIYKIQRP